MSSSAGRIGRCLVLLGIAAVFPGCRAARLSTPPDETGAASALAPSSREVSLPRRFARTSGAPDLSAEGVSAFLRTGLSPTGREGGASVPREPNLLLLPVELEADNGAANGDANLVRFLPAYEWPRRSGWRIQHMDLITLAEAPGGITGTPGNPEPVAGARVAGLSDITHLSFFAPRQSGSLIWGAGAALGIPTATDDVLGSGKWTAGPALRVTYREKPWNLGFVAGQRWSFAGDSSRAAFNQLLVRGAFRRQLGEHWYLLSAPILTANWNASASDRWLVPLGGGIGRTFDLGGRSWAVSVQGYANVIRPAGAPTWSLRLSVTAILPLDP